MAINERPGVYSSYEVTSALAGASTGAVIGLAAEASAHVGEARLITSYTQACTDYGAGSQMAELVRILLQNGAGEIHAAAVQPAAAPLKPAYPSAFDLLKADSRISLLVCGSHDPAVHAALRESIMNADESNRYRIGFVEAVGAASELIAQAAALNCERMVLVTPGALDTGVPAVAPTTLMLGEAPERVSKLVP